MPVPYLKHMLFDLNPNLTVDTGEIEGVGKIVIIENFFKYPEEIKRMLDQSWVTSWKNSPTSKNFVDYYDCRFDLSRDITSFRSDGYQALIRELADTELGIRCNNYEVPTSFNVFQWLNPPASHHIQSRPHIDGRNLLASIVYLDKYSNGGTAFYTKYRELDYTEEDDIRYDIDKHADLTEVVEANFNRCVIYPGQYPHGAYINDHNIYTGENWRMNMVMFMEMLDKPN